MDIKNKLVYLSLVALMSLWTATTLMGAEPEKKKEAPKADTGEVDISDVQNQYWKAHDKEFEVIQNKKFAKAGRWEFSPLFGIYQRVDFQDTKTLGGALTYNFTELWGAELMAHKMFTSNSAVLTRFQQTRNATIEFNTEKYYLGVAPVFTPIYAKFSFLGNKISHFDLYISPNLGVTKTIDHRLTYGVGVGQKFWVSPKVNIRVEYRWSRYNDKTPTSQGVTATQNGGPGFFEDTVTNANLMFGISYLFN